MESSIVLGGLGSLLGVCGSLWYIISIIRRETRPHAFTWIVWTILTMIAYFAQLHEESGPGTWIMGVTAINCLIITLLSLKYGDKHRTRNDKIALSASLLAIIPWVLTKDPLGSVILISLIDAVAFYPTFRKSWMKPHEENLVSYWFANVKYLLSFAALNVYTLNTLLYPLVCIILNTSFTLMCFIRRTQLKAKIR